jgi:protein TonB
VRSAGSKPQTQSDESAPPPSPIADASTSGSLTGLIASAGASPARPSLATLKISQGVSQGLLIKRVQPKYPPAALAVHAQGLVLIEAIINKEGVVTNPKVISGDPVLARAALDAVRQWRYKPYYLDREPVEIQTQITINFKAN